MIQHSIKPINLYYRNRRLICLSVPIAFRFAILLLAENHTFLREICELRGIFHAIDQVDCILPVHQFFIKI